MGSGCEPGKSLPQLPSLAAGSPEHAPRSPGRQSCVRLRGCGAVAAPHAEQGGAGGGAAGIGPTVSLPDPGGEGAGCPQAGWPVRPWPHPHAPSRDLGSLTCRPRAPWAASETGQSQAGPVWWDLERQPRVWPVAQMPPLGGDVRGQGAAAGRGAESDALSCRPPSPRAEEALRASGQARARRRVHRRRRDPPDPAAPAPVTATRRHNCPPPSPKYRTGQQGHPALQPPRP